MASRCRLSGTVPIIIYLHRIQDNRIAGSAMRNLDSLKTIGNPGEASGGKLSNIALVTTMWSEIPNSSDVGERRERELKNDHWRDLLRMGCQYKRFDDSHKSAWSIINMIAVQDSSGVATELDGRFRTVMEGEQERINDEEVKKKSLMSKFFGLFKFGRSRR